MKKKKKMKTTNKSIILKKEISKKMKFQILLPQLIPTHLSLTIQQHLEQDILRLQLHLDSYTRLKLIVSIILVVPPNPLICREWRKWINNQVNNRTSIKVNEAANNGARINNGARVYVRANYWASINEMHDYNDRTHFYKSANNPASDVNEATDSVNENEKSSSTIGQ